VDWYQLAFSYQLVCFYQLIACSLFTIIDGIDFILYPLHTTHYHYPSNYNFPTLPSPLHLIIPTPLIVSSPPITFILPVHSLPYLYYAITCYPYLYDCSPLLEVICCCGGVVMMFCYVSDVIVVG
jgi:hypothetical protein